MVPPPPPPALAAPAPHPLEAAALDFCRKVAPQMGWEARVDPPRMRVLRAQAAAMLSVCGRALPPESRALPLLEAGLGALESAGGEESRGERRFGRAARTLALRWRSAQKAWGAGDPRRLPELENLALLYELGGLRASLWRDEALRIRAARLRAPDPSLEQELAVAVEDHYGPWLAAAEVEPMLEFCRCLARAWLDLRDDRELTRRVLKLGLKPEAERVWRLAARRAGEGLRADLAALVARLDADTLLADKGVDVVRLGEALAGTPLEEAGRGLLERLEARLAGEDRPETGPLRRRIARALGDWSGLAGLLERGLGEAPGQEELAGLLDEAERLLREHPDGALLEAGTRRLEVLARSPRPGEGGLAPRLEAWAGLLGAAGRGEEAELLLRLRLALEDPRGEDTESRSRLLARLGRWEELEALLGPPAEGESGRVLGWRFRAALGRGEEGAAQRWIEAWLARVAGPEAPEEPSPLPGLSAAIPRLRARTEALARLAARCGPRLLPGQEALLAREPWRILAALDPGGGEDLLPARAEEALRWRWSRLPAGESREAQLERLAKEAEARLGPSHVLVAELLAELGEARKEEGLGALEQARDILGAAEGREALLARVHLAMAGLCSLEDGPGLERNLLRAMELLERASAPKEGLEDAAREMPVLLLLQLWREQRLEDLLALGPRVQAFVRHSPEKDADAELGRALGAVARLARLQARLRGAGLP